MGKLEAKKPLLLVFNARRRPRTIGRVLTYLTKLLGKLAVTCGYVILIVVAQIRVGSEKARVFSQVLNHLICIHICSGLIMQGSSLKRKKETIVKPFSWFAASSLETLM